MNFLDELKAEKDRIVKIIKTAQSKLEKLPVGKMRISAKHGGQYFIYSYEKQKWEYKAKSEYEYLKKFAQRDYEEHVISGSLRQLKVLERFLEEYKSDYLSKLYSELHPLRIKMIKPYEIPDEQFVQEWLSVKYQKNPYPINSGFVTSNGELVRSKSEALIADRLIAFGIPYRYECPLLVGNVTIYPDFTLLDVSSRKEVVFEHFGMMDNPEYVNRFLLKIDTYAKYGFINGKNLLCSFESGIYPLNLEYVDSILKDIRPSKH